MARLSINEVTTYRWSFEEDVLNYRAANINAIGVWRQKLTDFGEDKGADLLAEHGMQVSNLLWAGGFTGSDGHTYRDSLRDAAEAIRLAATLKAGCLVVYSGGRNGHTQNHARRLFSSALSELLPMATEHGVTLAIEPMHCGCAEEWTFLTTLEGAWDLVSAIDHPRLKLAFDTYHFGHDDNICDRLREMTDRIAIVHLGDSKTPPEPDQNRQCLGQGNLPLGDIVRTLCQAGYDGYYDVELMGEDIETADYRDIIASSKRAYDQLLSMAAVA